MIICLGLPRLLFFTYYQCIIEKNEAIWYNLMIEKNRLVKK